MSLTTEISRIVDAKNEIKRAINAKGGTLLNERLSEYAAAIDNLTPTDFRNRVRFIDYDGTILKTMYVADGESATPPDAPSHNKMVFQGWNCSLENIVGHRDIGAIYTTASGKCEFDIRLLPPTGLTVSFMPRIENGTLTVDWGNGVSNTYAAEEWLEASYTYEDYGNYTITMSISEGGSWYIPEGFCGWYYSNYYLKEARITGVKQIYGNSFSSQGGLKTIAMSRDVETLGYGAFSGCSALVAAILPDSLTTIESNVFMSCTALSYIVFSDSLTAIPNQICQHCNCMDAVTIPDGIKSIGNYAFNECHALSELYLPEGLESIGEYAFCNCLSIRELKLPSTLTHIGNYGFQDCHSIEEIYLPDSITYLGSRTFYQNYSLKKIRIPTSITSIPSYLCYRCRALENIEFPENITDIGDYAFYDCFRLKEVHFHENIATLRSCCFQYCHAMGDYYCHRTTPPTMTSNNALSNIPGSCTIWVPKSDERTILTAYRTASNWSTYANYMAEMEE